MKSNVGGMTMNGTSRPESRSWQVLSLDDILIRIETLNISADAKALLADLATATVEIGGKIIKAGQQILSFIFDLARRYPNTTFGVTVGYVLSALLASVPLLGPLLAALLGPILIAFGLAAGAVADFRDRAIIARVELLEREFNALDLAR